MSKKYVEESPSLTVCRAFRTQQQQQPWEALLNHVNVSLAQSGFPMLSSSLFLKSQTHLPILNTIYSLLQQKQVFAPIPSRKAHIKLTPIHGLQKDAVFRQDLQERLSILDSENQQLDSQWVRESWKDFKKDTHTRLKTLTQSKAKAKCDQSYKEISSLKNRTDILQTENKAIHSQMLLQKEELKTLKSNLAFTKTQAAHDVRKKAQELDKMKTRLQKLMNEKSGLKMGISLVNPLPKASSTVLMDGSKKKETAVSVLALCTK